MEDNKDKEVETGLDNDAETDLPKTKEELDALLQQYGDKRVTEALKKQEFKNKKKLEEAKKLAQMDEAQRYEYELQQREAAIEEKEKELALAENKAEASKILASKGISAELVNFVVAETADEMNANISLLEKEFKKSVKAEIEKRLASNTPKKGLAQPNTITKDQFMKMTYTELAELRQNEPELYDSLANSRY